MGHTTGVFPSKGLRYPKGDEKPPFMTRAEIERRLDGERDPDALWECLYLTADEVTRLLAHVREYAAQPWLYPLFTFAAHTGARRSEILRVRIIDVDLSSGVVTLREKKRKRSENTTRRVPLTALLRQVLQDWLAVHPGGPFLFCQAGTVARSKKRSGTTGHKGQKARAKTTAGRKASVRRREPSAPAVLTRNEVHDHFKRVLRGSEWQHVRGLHCLRHSFISACASKAVDQRLIDAWVGHSTEEQRKRYRHLYPSVQQAAIGAVFD
jgi:integrase